MCSVRAVARTVTFNPTSSAPPHRWFLNFLNFIDFRTQHYQGDDAGRSTDPDSSDSDSRPYYAIFTKANERMQVASARLRLVAHLTHFYANLSYCSARKLDALEARGTPDVTVVAIMTWLEKAVEQANEFLPF